ncbi:hypothetical protein D9M71_544580 [compost metagenome]
MSSRSLISSSAERSELSMCCTNCWASSFMPSACCDKAAEKSRAAFNGCIRSWLTAARKRVLDLLTASAWLLASDSAWFNCDSSWVRSATRCSRRSLASRRACSIGARIRASSGAQIFCARASSSDQ